MRVRFWGTRGSIATPGPGTLRYGGNTSCVEVRSAAGTRIIIDCGTGLRALGRAMSAEAAAVAAAAGPGYVRPPVHGHVLISHTHWDHIQGVPFFDPFFAPANEWDVYAPRGLAQSVRETLAGQMQYTYFPITLEALGANIRYHDLVEGGFRVGDVRVRTQYLNHPALTLGYRLEADGATVVYACDHEPHARRLAGGDGAIDGQDRRHADFLAGADLVIHDAQFTADEYPTRIGWGHSPAEYAAAVCRAAGARRLALTHHDPNRDDAAVDRLVEGVRRKLAAQPQVMEGSGPLDVFAAAEGQVVELGRSAERVGYDGGFAAAAAAVAHAAATAGAAPAVDDESALNPRRAGPGRAVGAAGHRGRGEGQDDRRRSGGRRRPVDLGGRRRRGPAAVRRPPAVPRPGRPAPAARPRGRRRHRGRRRRRRRRRPRGR
jgi:phosphoribosyl 1,2-cyclic phosphodiesterase